MMVGPLIAGFAGSYRRAPRHLPPSGLQVCFEGLPSSPKAPTARSGLTSKNEAGPRGSRFGG
jgi:hypothetical protein